MYLWDTLLVLLRRWYITVPVLLLTVSGCLLASKIVAPTYQANASMLFLIPSTVEGRDVAVNPYLNFGGANGLADVVGRLAMSPADARKIYSSGARAEYSVAMDPTTTAPLLDVTAKSKDPGQAMKTLTAVMADIKAQLSTVQIRASAPATTLVYTQDVTVSATPTELRGSLHRAIAVTAAIGIIIAIGLPCIVEGIVRRRALEWGSRQELAENDNRSREVVTSVDLYDDGGRG